MAKTRLRLRIFLLFLVIELAVALLVSAAFSARYYWDLRKIADVRLQETLSVVTRLYPIIEKPEQFLVEAQQNSNKYQEIRAHLLEIRQASDVTDIYIILEQNGQYWFFVDTGVSNLNRNSNGIAIYEKPVDAFMQCIQSGEPVFSNPYRSELGAFVSYFIPLKNTLGNTIGTLAAEYDLDVIQGFGNEVLLANFIALFAALVLSVLLSWFASRKMAADEEAKRNFLARMSHEIRSPMNAIIGGIELIRTDNLDDVQRGYFEDISTMSHALLGIVNDVLDFSKIDAGKLSLNPLHFNLWALFDNVTSMNRYLSTMKGLDFKAERSENVPQFMYADEIRIRQIFTNLISNAVKYTKTGFVEIGLKINQAPVRANNYSPLLEFTVRDSGIGIKSEDIPHVFEAFTQLDVQKNRGITGTGLGLPIVKQLVDMMGGKIEIESIYGKGSLFRVFLPFVAGDAAEVLPDTDTVPALVFKPDNNLKILVVDDLPVNLTIALGFLARHGLSADTANNGYEALEKVKNLVFQGEQYDLIFMDHMMPGMDGIETSKKIRELGVVTPIIALTANAIAGARELFLSNGMNDFISKPISDSELNRILVDFLLKKTGNSIEENSADETVIENNVSFEERIQQSVKRELPKEKELLKKLFQEEDWENFGIKAHSLKGLFAQIAENDLSEQAKELEFAAKEGNVALCKEKTAPFITAMETYIKQIGEKENE
ncbi:MAG: response regulator [Spirochaetaceae bacterium]|jgi:signal transduction histidine kinase/DNA-binding response OmpR family regulator|nr:response regulator [Spirochaetaceae bacterium]